MDKNLLVHLKEEKTNIERVTLINDGSMNNPLRILFIDDSEDDPVMITRELQHNGYELMHERINTPEALEVALQQPWDIVVSEYVLLRFSGLAALRMIKEKGLDLPVIIFSSIADEKIAAELMRAGARDWIAKGNWNRLIIVVNREVNDAIARKKCRWVGEALSESEAKNQALLNLIPDLIFRVDKRGNFLDCNYAKGFIFRQHPSQFLGKKIRDVMPPQASQKIEFFLHKAIETKLTQSVEYHFNFKGQTHYQEARLVANGENEVLIIIRDFTKSKQAEDALEHSNLQNKLILEAVGDGICGIDHIGRITFINPAGSKMIGFKPDEIIGQCEHEIFHHTFVDGVPYPKAECPILANLQDIKPHQVNNEIFWRKNGTNFAVEYVSTPLIKNNEIIGAVVVFKDITQRKQAQDDLQESKERYRSLVQQSSEGIFIFDPTTRRIQEANDKFLKMLGYTESEVAQLALENIVDLEIEDIKQNVNNIIEKGKIDIGSSRYRRKDGTFLEVEIYGSRIRYHDKQVVMANVLDVTHQRQAAEALKQSFFELNRTLEETVKALAALAEKRDPYTAGHQQRVANLACAIAKKMGFSDHIIQGIRVAGVLHDIGKINVPTDILNKPGVLNEIEMALIRTHPQIGYEILKNIPFSWPIADIVLQHQERINGSGYPLKLTAKEILQEAKVIAVADVVEAMASHRPYRPALGMERALDEIQKNKGTHYDPLTVEVCYDLFISGEFSF